MEGRGEKGCNCFYVPKLSFEKPGNLEIIPVSLDMKLDSLGLAIILEERSISNPPNST
jgi:hypothetical protein